MSRVNLKLVERAKALFVYNEDTGDLIWENPSGRRVKKGDIAGRVNNTGHLGIGIDGSRYQAHQIIWVWFNGEIPEGYEVDHKDENKLNNRIQNLRLATRSQNMCNITMKRTNKSGFKGVSFHVASGKWGASVVVDRKKHYLGLYETSEEAADVAAAKRKELHGKFFK